MATNSNFTLPNNLLDLNRITHNRLWSSIDSLTQAKKDNPENLRILHHNAKSLFKKHYFYESLNLENSCDIFSVSETWLKPSIPDTLVNLPGFNIIRNDRSSTIKTRAGGAAIYVSSDLHYSVLSQPSTVLAQYCNSVWIKLNTHNQTLIVASIYLPPDSDKNQFTDALSSLLTRKTFASRHIVLLGDFNINWNCQSTAKTHFEHALKAHGLIQRVTGITFTSYQGKESLIDHNFVSQSVQVKSCKILTCEKDISDHYATHLVLKSPCEIKPRELIQFRNYSKLDREAFFCDATQIPFLPMATNTNISIHDRVQYLEESINKLLDQHAPLKTIRVRGPKNKWMTNDLLKLINLKNQFHRKVYLSPNTTENQFRHYQRFRNYTLSQIRKAKKTYYASQLSADNKSFFDCLRNLTGKKSKPTQIECLNVAGQNIYDKKAIANHLNNFFH